MKILYIKTTTTKKNIPVIKFYIHNNGFKAEAAADDDFNNLALAYS